MATRTDKRIRVPVLSRVEGEGALELDIQQGELKQVRLRIFEPPRLFEQAVPGHTCDEVVDMVARICGICPVAYQITAAQAFERLFAIDLQPEIGALRRVMYCAEWIQSHALHIHLLALPDFLGFTDAIQMAGQYPDEVRRGLRLQTLGNDMIQLFGGRAVHPVGLRVGGFYRLPAPEKIAGLIERIERAIPDAEDLLSWLIDLPRPDGNQDFVSVALRAADHYAIDGGEVVADDGFACDVAAWGAHIQEYQVPHSTALHAVFHGQPYLVGPLARLNLNVDFLPESLRRLLAWGGLQLPSRNMFDSVIARAAELVAVLSDARDLLRECDLKVAPSVAWQPRAGVAIAATEAPRGLLWQRYEVDARGFVTAARIVPPTSQNQARCEQDIRASLLAYGLDHSDDALRQRAEMVIRNYDPCISCATHFLKLKVQRR